MTWFLLSLSCGFLQSINDAFTKRVGASHAPQNIALIGSLGALFILVPLGLTWGIQVSDWRLFTQATVASAIIGFAATSLYIRSLSSADLSLSLPLINLSPLFILITGPLINHEWPTSLGMLGVMLAVMGTYSLNFSKREVSIFRPFGELWINKGMRRMVLVAMLWAISAPLEKVAVQASTPRTYLTCMIIIVAAFQAVSVMCNKPARSAFSWSAVYSIGPRGFLIAFTTLLQMTALPLAPVAYIITLKRTSVLWGMLWGVLIFKEAFLGERLIGALITFLGMILILAGG